MKLHHIRLKIRERSKQRIGRGGKRGSYSGRGVKGQKSRSGRKLRPAQRDLILRIPKLRGFRNKAKKIKPIVFNLSDVEVMVKAHSESGAPIVVTREFFLKSGLISPGYRGDIKILSQGKISAPFTLQGILVSKRTREKIEKARGKIL